MIHFRLGKPGIRLFDSQRIIFLLWLFLLLFPKGGVKISGIPITWGYLFLGIVSCLIHLKRDRYIVHNSRILNYLFLVPFQIVSLLTFVMNGLELNGAIISFFVSFFFLPYVFLLLFSQDIESLDWKKFSRLFKLGVFFISSYGILLFLCKQLTGTFIEIPLLTTNYGDLGQLEEKHIDRGFAFKLISTYNNGNIYGVCLLMLLPLYCCLETAFWKRLIVKGSLLLTLSRTVWIGYVVHEVLYSIFFEKKINLSIIGLLLFIASLSSLSFYYNFSLVDFIIDPNLGGNRRESLAHFQDLSFFPLDEFAIAEVTYAGILASFGVVGLITFFLGMGGMMIVCLMRGSLSKIHKSICFGLLNYLFISWSDGAILFIPVMAFYWFLCSLLARNEFDYENCSCT